MTDESVFFDYESDEYKALMDPYEAAKQEHEAISARHDAARRVCAEAETDYHISRQKLAELWKPVNSWYWEQNQLRSAWQREQQDKEPGNE